MAQPLGDFSERIQDAAAAADDWRGVRERMAQVRDELLIVKTPVPVEDAHGFDEQIAQTLEAAEALRPGFAQTYFEYVEANSAKARPELAGRALRSVAL